jgi:hypothetical protein
MGNLGKDRYRDKLLPSKTADKLIKIYKSILVKPRGNHSSGKAERRAKNQ